ncbi:MAG: CRISPR-associated endonuclease Cas1 [Pirellulaceae bacterium]|nr:CRISPR-associated endonuclease Cas1 [Pirellulaceae bacterium]
MIHDRATSQEQDTQFLPTRMLHEFLYCPRLFYLEYVEGLSNSPGNSGDGSSKTESFDKDHLADGRSKVETPPRNLHVRCITLSSNRYELIAKLDLIDANGGLVIPVDHRSGGPDKCGDGKIKPWETDRLQLGVMALLLRDNGYQCDRGIVVYSDPPHRVEVCITAELFEYAKRTVDDAQAVVKSQSMPRPLVDSPKCAKCSLVGICLPDEVKLCSRQSAGVDFDRSQRLLFDIGTSPVTHDNADNTDQSADSIRRLVPSRDERRAVYLNTQGIQVGKSGRLLRVKEKGEVIQELRLRDVLQVNLMGSIQMSTQAVQSLMQADVPLLYFSRGGWFYGMTQSVGLKNIIWRREQFRWADDPGFCLQLAKQLIVGKIRNQRTVLRRNHRDPPRESLRFLKAMVNEAQQSESQASLLGIEGLAARVYFEQFAGMLKSVTAAGQKSSSRKHAGTELSFEFKCRNRRPPRDPVNALLSLGYSLLVKDLTVTCASVGLDPYLGYYHQPRFGRPALALDLMEPFRALIVDSAVLSALNQRMVTLTHFQRVGNAVSLTADGRKGFFRAYEQRMDQLVTHPIFGYRVSYRRVLEIQVRLVARLLMGEINEYPAFVTR